MLDLTATFDGLLKKHEAPPTKRSFSLDRIDEFLKEAYRINSHILSLHTHLKDVRQAYLSTAPQRKSHLRAQHQHRAANESQRHLTDRQREEIDANAKQMLRELNASIRALSEGEELRRETELELIRRKYSRGLGVLGSWAADAGGGLGLGGSGKSKEHLQAEERAKALSTHRESVLWFLRQRLQLCLQTQQVMMETRLTREVEKNRSTLASAPPAFQPAAAHRSDQAAGHRGLLERSGSLSSGSVKKHPHVPLREEEREKRRPVVDDLTPEQLQMFEEGAQDMMKYYEGTLDKVMAAEKSLLEISELQSVLVNSLATQSANIDKLVSDSFFTEENVGGGNKQLKKATQRPSTARYTFFAASGLCLFLIVWDLLI